MNEIQFENVFIHCKHYELTIEENDSSKEIYPKKNHSKKIQLEIKIRQLRLIVAILG